MDTVLGLCPSQLWNIKVALIAAHLTAEVILVITVYTDRYIISFSPHRHTPFPPFPPSLISLMISVDVKHHAYLLRTPSPSPFSHLFVLSVYSFHLLLSIYLSVELIGDSAWKLARSLCCLIKISGVLHNPLYVWILLPNRFHYVAGESKSAFHNEALPLCSRLTWRASKHTCSRRFNRLVPDNSIPISSPCQLETPLQRQVYCDIKLQNIVYWASGCVASQWNSKHIPAVVIPFLKDLIIRVWYKTW